MKIASAESRIHQAVAYKVTPYYVFKHLDMSHKGYVINCIIAHESGNKLFLLTNKFRIVIYKFSVCNYTPIIESLVELENPNCTVGFKELDNELTEMMDKSVDFMTNRLIDMGFISSNYDTLESMLN